MKSGVVRAIVVVAAIALAIPAASLTHAANGPWIVVADSGDGSGTAINLSNGTDQHQPGLGGQLIGAAAVSGTIAFSDFLGGQVKTLQANPVGDFLGVGKGSIGTSPDNPNPEGITLLGEGARAFISDGGSVPGGTPISLILVDLSTNTRVSTLPMPSVYGVAYNSATRIAYVLDGVSMQIAAVGVAPNGTLTDTGVRIPVHGKAQGVRFIALYDGGTRLLVSHKTDGAVEVIDIASQSTMGTLTGLGTAVGAIAVTPDGTRALVADYAGSQWAVLDLTPAGMPVDTGIRVPVPTGVPNTFVGTKTFAFLGDDMYFSSTDGNGVASMNWKTLAVQPEYYATGAAPAGLDISF